MERESCLTNIKLRENRNSWFYLLQQHFPNISTALNTVCVNNNNNYNHIIMLPSPGLEEPSSEQSSHNNNSIITTLLMCFRRRIARHARQRVVGEFELFPKSMLRRNRDAKHNATSRRRTR